MPPNHPTPELLSDEQIAEIEARTNAATEGPWESDNATDEADRSQYYMALAPGGKVILDSLNSSIAEIHEDADEDGYYRWDEVGRKNIAFVVHARTDIPALCQTVRALKDANKALAKDVVTATNQAHKYRDESESLRNQQWTAARVISWLDDPLPKPAIHAFTEGNERQIAYRVERLREQLAQLTKERDDALMWLKIHKNDPTSSDTEYGQP